jgi:16S rRNA (uracil1498-N3)-methyltransferase
VNLILLEAAELRDGEAVLHDKRAGHLINVLKVAAGDNVRIGIVDGAMGVGRVRSVGDDAVVLRCAFEPDVTDPPPVDLLLALPRPKVLRRLWAQLAALGVGRIAITNAERVERNYFDTHVLTPACYRPLLIEGLQQARDTRLPTVSVHRQFRALVEDQMDAIFPDGLRLVAHPGEQTPLTATVRGHSERRVVLAVGPEGGWNDFELALLEAHRFVPVDIGPRTLRTDTACLALLTLVHDAMRARI